MWSETARNYMQLCGTVVARRRHLDGKLTQQSVSQSVSLRMDWSHCQRAVSGVARPDRNTPSTVAIICKCVGASS